jgi:aldehyde:ferredoxin oxidoreductase
MFGWKGSVLKIDLTAKKLSTITPKEDVYHTYIGGKGLAGYYLRKYITQSWDSPSMPLLLFTGPLVDTPSPTSGRMTVMSRSPLTGTVGDASVGGNFGCFLKRAGYDGIIITGKSEDICGIEIVDSEVTFTKAKDLTELKTDEIYEKLKEKGSVATIGPAAHNGVKYSAIVFDSHYFAGRNGLGLIFASKNLKYITVKGTGKTEVFDKATLKVAREDIFRLTSASPVLMGELGISNYGTGALYDLVNSRRMMPTENFKKTYYENSLSMNAASYKKKYSPKKAGCRGCHILCKKVTQSGTVMPEFETMSHFSALLGNDSIDTVTQANRLCNEYGMDTISAGGALSCYSEIENVTLSPEKILSLLNDIGSGDSELKNGAFRYAQSKNKPNAAITVKKLELPAYDPRGAFGMAIAYSTSSRGGCHLRAYPISHEILRKPVSTDRFTFSGKARIIKIAEDANAIVDSLTACKFIFLGVTLEEYAKAFSAVTGLKTTAQDLLTLGERICYNERIMNSQNGFSRKDDKLPRRFFEEPGTSGNNIEIPKLNEEDFDQTISNYYEIRGLDDDGQPLKEKCEELFLPWMN